MLKALELLGFKSFADRTRFEFPRGISAVVGPNGSGKSNIVDAIKWVLGEQSVKSLRGKEMADVIFNGSGARRPMNTAEVTLTLDNANKLLAIDAPEVQITRRVYRSGEGEYLLNRNPARLRDIRDLLSGTGMGTQAYSVIEQGKVDVLLQSSPRDRRIIFEEAAGISRYKTRKLEALRRLERVDQNLLRLHDIIDEVESRLKSVRSQAGKARRYKEYCDRLQELRTQVALVDWRRLTERLDKIENEMRALSDQRDADAAAAESGEARLLETDRQLGEVNEALREAEARNAANRERIASEESAVEHERARLIELEEEIARRRRQLTALSARSGGLEQELAQTTAERQTAEEKHLNVARSVGEAERELTELMAVLDQLRAENEQHRAAYMQQMRSAAALGNERSALESQVEAARAAAERCAARLAELERQLAALGQELAQWHGRRDDAIRRTETHRQRVASLRNDLDEKQQELRGREEELTTLRTRHSGMSERMAILEEFVRGQEGLSAGVKEVLARAANPEDAPFRAVRGLVADLIDVKIEAAPLVEIALGPAAQYVVAEPDGELFSFLHREGQRLSGRVGFVWLDPEEAGNVESRELKVESESLTLNSQHSTLGSLEGRPGVLGRADRFVETDPTYAPLAERLLGHTWFVENLAHARKLLEECGMRSAECGNSELPVALPHSAFRTPHSAFIQFVTLAGELLTADGTLVVGSVQATSGIITRRSELRSLRTQWTALDSALAEATAATEQLRREVAGLQQALAEEIQVERQAAEALSELRLAISTAEQRRAQWEEQRAVEREEFAAAQSRHDRAAAQLAAAQEKRWQIETELADGEKRLAALADQIGQHEKQRLLGGRETTEAKVELAKSEERLRNLDLRLRQMDESRQERRKALDECREQLADALRRAETARQNILDAEAEIAKLYLRKESSAGQTIEHVNRREALLGERGAAAEEVQKIRGRIRKHEEKIHTLDLSANEIRHERGTLADRIREDYGVELADLDHDAGLENPEKRAAVQEEIDGLRQKIANLGNVNLEALDELQQLESRYQTLSEQHRDLTEAKQSLEKIIEKINADSRRLFEETLTEVRGHFQKLFRDLFGGGQADIVMETGVDILESGIEIVGRPPGKEPRSISLLSGGEKTLTCAALLLAIFRSRPSPFCVLDEVDAALDEANIDRFTKVLQDFLSWTQFIIVTHSKKTMTCASTIYGVTMQESGISKQVSVRFEDVRDDGTIVPERLKQAEAESEAA
jgi:chromosome segregation protein